MTTSRDWLASSALHNVLSGYGNHPTGTAYAVEIEMGRPGCEYWTTVLVAGEPTVYDDLARARKIKSYLRYVDRRTFTTVRPSRIVKMTITREVL